MAENPTCRDGGPANNYPFPEVDNRAGVKKQGSKFSQGEANSTQSTWEYSDCDIQHLCCVRAQEEDQRNCGH